MPRQHIPYRNPGNFPHQELTFSQTAVRAGIRNQPAEWQWEILEGLAKDVLQPARNELGPIRITSGYRSPALNRRVGGSGKSDHMILERPKAPLKRPCAADISPAGNFLLLDLFGYIHDNLPWARLIWEFGRWVHVSYDAAGVPTGRERFLLEAKHVNKSGRRIVEYSVLDPSDLSKLV